MTAKLTLGVIKATDGEIECRHKFNLCLQEKFGSIDFRSETIPFNYTEYYEKEMGTELKREWLGFERPIQPENLKSIKLTTMEIENKFRRPDHTRTVNLDPGYITLSNMVLASTKNYSHRIYLGDGIYAEVTLIYQNNHFHSLDWTYPDYRANLNVFEDIRDKFKNMSI